jgi:transcriptional regulator with XRE-family HTH domain
MIFLMDSMWKTVSKNFIRMAIERPEIKATEIAVAAGVTRDMVYKWKKGENIPDVDKIDLLAKLFRVEPIDFYRGSSNVTPFYGNASLRKYLVIPDKIVEMLCDFGTESPVWKNIEQAIILQRQLDALHSRQGKDSGDREPGT